MQDEIAKRIEEIFRTIPEKLPEGKLIEIVNGIMNNPATGRLGVVVNPIGEVFLGALGKAILDSLTVQVEGLLSSDIGRQLIDKKIKELSGEGSK